MADDTDPARARILEHHFSLHEERDGRSVNWALSSGGLREVASRAQGKVTAETGCGVSTLLFAEASTEHHCFTLLQSEVERIQAEAARMGVDLSSVRFYVGDSTTALPPADLPQLDFALIDGSHAFPYPITDWYYLQRTMTPGAVMAVDDVWIPAVALLVNFLQAEEHWLLLRNDGQTAWFERLEQPSVAGRYQDGWDVQGINRGAGLRVEAMRRYSSLSRRNKIRRHPLLTARVLIAKARRKMAARAAER